MSALSINVPFFRKQLQPEFAQTQAAKAITDTADSSSFHSLSSLCTLLFASAILYSLLQVWLGFFFSLFMPSHPPLCRSSVLKVNVADWLGLFSICQTENRKLCVLNQQRCFSHYGFDGDAYIHSLSLSFSLSHIHTDTLIMSWWAEEDFVSGVDVGTPWKIPLCLTFIHLDQSIGTKKPNLFQPRSKLLFFKPVKKYFLCDEKTSDKSINKYSLH